MIPPEGAEAFSQVLVFKLDAWSVVELEPLAPAVVASRYPGVAELAAAGLIAAAAASWSTGHDMAFGT